MSQARVNSKWGSDKDKMPHMTTAAVASAEELKARIAEMSSPQKKAVTETLQFLYDARMSGGNKRVLTLLIPTVLISMTNPDNQ